MSDDPREEHTRRSPRPDVIRGGSTVFPGSTDISRLKRGFAELVGYLYKETTFPSGYLLMTGTGIVPPDVFTLHHEDVIEIVTDGIGTLRNIVE